MKKLLGTWLLSSLCFVGCGTENGAESDDAGLDDPGMASEAGLSRCARRDGWKYPGTYLVDAEGEKLELHFDACSPRSDFIVSVDKGRRDALGGLRLLADGSVLFARIPPAPLGWVEWYRIRYTPNAEKPFAGRFTHQRWSRNRPIPNAPRRFDARSFPYVVSSIPAVEADPIVY